MRVSRTRAMLSLPLTAVVCLAPLPALADGSIAESSFQLRTPLTSAPIGMKLRGYLSIQDPTTETAEPAVEGEVAPEAPPPTAGPQPYPPQYPPPGYGPPPSNPPPRGLGMLISGAVVTGAVALPSLIFGAYTIAVFRQAADLADEQNGEAAVVRGAGNIAGGFFIVFGLLALGAGVPLLAIGGVRMKKYNDWKAGRQVQILPSSSRTVHGTWVTGMQVRF